MAMVANTKPQNHVTREQVARALAHLNGGELPALGMEDIAKLQQVYPQRCIGQHEDAEDYRWYAAKAALVAELAIIADNAREQRLNAEPDYSRHQQMVEDNMLAIADMEWAGNQT